MPSQYLLPSHEPESLVIAIAIAIAIVLVLVLVPVHVLVTSTLLLYRDGLASAPGHDHRPVT